MTINASSADSAERKATARGLLVEDVREAGFVAVEDDDDVVLEVLQDGPPPSPAAIVDYASLPMAGLQREPPAYE
ncbi:MAG: hypothetical protein ACFCVE_08830 [Phycisphaerae bacterium]